MTRKRDKYGREIKEIELYGRYYKISPEKVKYTVAIRNRLTGKFMGRYSGSPKSDGTKVVRIIKSVDTNNDNVPELHPGQVVGRLSRYNQKNPDHIKVKVHVSNAQATELMRETQRDKFRAIRAMLKNKGKRRSI
jgi:hypothetical protein